MNPHGVRQAFRGKVGDDAGEAQAHGKGHIVAGQQPRHLLRWQQPRQRRPRVVLRGPRGAHSAAVLCLLARAIEFP